MDQLLETYVSVRLSRASSRTKVMRILESNIDLSCQAPAPSIDKIARHSEMSVSAIYRYFSNRQKLHAASLQHLIGQFRQDFRTLLTRQEIHATDIDDFSDHLMNRVNHFRPALVNLLCSLEDDETARLLKANRIAMMDLVRSIFPPSGRPPARCLYERDMAPHLEDIATLLFDHLYQCPDPLSESSNRLRLKALMRHCLMDLNFYTAPKARIVTLSTYQFG